MWTSVQNTIVLLLMTSTSIIANPVPADPATLASEMYDLSTRQDNKAANAPQPEANPATSSTGGKYGNGTACSPEVAALASGIAANIADQRNEKLAVTAIGYMLEESPMNSSTFDSAKASLLDFVQKGITIRENNQKIAPQGNAAIPGLAKVAMAQQEELNLSKSLSAEDVKASKATVLKLEMDFTGGIVQNMKNLAAAKAGYYRCVIVFLDSVKEAKESLPESETTKTLEGVMEICGRESFISYNRKILIEPSNRPGSLLHNPPKIQKQSTPNVPAQLITACKRLPGGMEAMEWTFTAICNLINFTSDHLWNVMRQLSECQSSQLKCRDVIF
ncbi:hypothetical protein NHQ30_004343 [Ciborinia camelliae]|nr:hypothetical protein NHQ30_004343 [Ciborinia camelliae]